MLEEHKIRAKERKHIVVDTMSLKESSIGQGLFEDSLSTISTTLAGIDFHPPPLQPPKSKFLSISLPNSANASPRLTSSMTKKKSRARSMESPCHGSDLTLKHHHHLLEEINLSRSKSCGEGRAYATSDEFDLWLTEPSAVEHDDKHHGKFSRTEAINESPTASGKDPSEVVANEEFKCSALCLYLPGFGKAKPVKARKKGRPKMDDGEIISRTVSLEKFECDSWASSTLFHEIEEGDSKLNSTYFDLPMELVKCNANDIDAPITSAFVFEKNLKGVLKNGSSTISARKSNASSPHVRFSTSSSFSSSCPASPPITCISPRLRKAREDFNAFLEAQSA